MHTTDMYGEKVEAGDRVEFEGFVEEFTVVSVPHATELELRDEFLNVVLSFYRGPDGLWYGVNCSQTGYGLLKIL